MHDLLASFIKRRCYLILKMAKHSLHYKRITCLFRNSAECFYVIIFSCKSFLLVVEIMTDVPSDTTCFILGQDVEGPDTVLNRFKRLVSLEQQDEDDSVDRERPKEGLRARVDNLSKNICDSESSVTNLVSRFEHLKTEIESLRSKKKQLRSVLVGLYIYHFKGIIRS